MGIFLRRESTSTSLYINLWPMPFLCLLTDPGDMRKPLADPKFLAKKAIAHFAAMSTSDVFLPIRYSLNFWSCYQKNKGCFISSQSQICVKIVFLLILFDFWVRSLLSLSNGETLLETKSSARPWKMDGWKTIPSFCRFRPIFRCFGLFVSFRDVYIETLPPTIVVQWNMGVAPISVSFQDNFPLNPDYGRFRVFLFPKVKLTQPMDPEKKTLNGLFSLLNM